MTVKVIGVVGQIGSGKDEVLKYLKANYGIPYISTGNIVRDIARSENKEADYVLNNDGSVEALHKQIDRLVTSAGLPG